MSKKWAGGKAGDPAGRPRYVALYHKEMDSMAFKTLSPAAVWLLAQIRKAWKGSHEKIELPFSRVSWKLKFKTFGKARQELVTAGFIRIIESGGLLNRPAVYVESEGWIQRSKALGDDPAAGYCVWHKNPKTKEKFSVWYPAKKGRKAQANAENLKKANATLARKRAGAATPQKRARPTAEKKKGQQFGFKTPSLMLKKRRLKSSAAKISRKTSDTEIRTAAESTRHRLQDSLAFIEREKEGHG